MKISSFLIAAFGILDLVVAIIMGLQDGTTARLPFYGDIICPLCLLVAYGLYLLGDRAEKKAEKAARLQEASNDALRRQIAFRKDVADATNRAIKPMIYDVAKYFGMNKPSRAVQGDIELVLHSRADDIFLTGETLDERGCFLYLFNDLFADKKDLQKYGLSNETIKSLWETYWRYKEDKDRAYREKRATECLQKFIADTNQPWVKYFSYGKPKNEFGIVRDRAVQVREFIEKHALYLLLVKKERIHYTVLEEMVCRYVGLEHPELYVGIKAAHMLYAPYYF